MWDELYVQHDINDAFKGGSQAENDPEQKVSDPHHGICKLEAQGEIIWASKGPEKRKKYMNANLQWKEKWITALRNNLKEQQ